MNKMATWIVEHRKLVMLLYGVFVLISLIGMQFVSIEYDLGSYLPANMNSIQGKQKLQQEFQMDGTATMMVKSTDLKEIQELRKKIQALPGVKEVIGIDAVEDIYKPIEFMDQARVDPFIQGDYSLLQIQFTEGNDSISTQKAIDEIVQMVEKEYYIAGPAAVSKDMRETSDREMIYYSLAAVAIITVILLLSSSTYHEPVLFFMTIGVAVAINMGTNAIFSKISSNTNSVSGILQLAVSMDYSIFLLHRFHEEKRQDGNNENAMVRAIQKTFGSVSASALTTICGFLALVAMEYGIGKDMGIVLAKGVFLSLLAVVTFMPCLILAVDEKFSKYTHKVYLPSFKKSAKGVVALRWTVVIVAIVIAIPVFLGQSKLDYYYSTEKTLSEHSVSVEANRKVQEVFGKKNEVVLILPKGDKVALTRLMEEIRGKDAVDSVQGLYSMVDKYLPRIIIPQEAKDAFESEEYTYLAINLLSGLESGKTAATLKEIRDTAATYYDTWYLTGEAAVYMDLQQVTSKDFQRVTLISILLIGMVLVFTFKSLTLPVLILFVIQLSIWINLSIPYFQGSVLNFISFIIIGAIQLGATVDYAILFTTRYKENLEEMAPVEAMKKTIGDTGRSVLASALILIAGTLSVSFITTIRSASELTLLIGRGAFISFILVFTLLPALLLIFNPLIRRTTLHWPRGSIHK